MIDAKKLEEKLEEVCPAVDIAEPPPWMDEGPPPNDTHDETKVADPLESVRASIRSDLEAGPEAIDAAEPPRFVQYPRLPEAGASLCGPGGTGKTALALTEKVRVACGLPAYPDTEPCSQGPCVLVTAEDGADRARYVLQRALADAVDNRQITEAQAQEAKHLIRVVGWHPSRYGRIVKVEQFTGEMYRAPVYDLLLELLAPIKPVYITLDPEALFAPGERYGNDGHAFLSAMMHETAMQMHACVQMLDHVSQNVARSGTVDQYASRGGTAKSDEARLVRQLVGIKPETLKPDEPLPLMVTQADLAAGRILRLHWTKLSWAKPNAGPPVWLRRTGYWFEALRSPSPAEYTAEREQNAAQRDSEELSRHAAAVVEYIGRQLTHGAGVRLTASELATEGGPIVDGKRLKRDTIRRAVRHAVAQGLLTQLELPKAERQGSRQTYLAPTDYRAPSQPECAS
ncbi:MAG: AAA family ATPase [Steroidobacteraceae bacterium]